MGMFHYRDHQKREIDLVLELRDGAVVTVEVTALTMFSPMPSLEDGRFCRHGRCPTRWIDRREYADRHLTSGSGSRPIVCFPDEIQVVAGWERLVRRLLDTRDVEVSGSSSSAALLSREIATALRGRGWQVPIHPSGSMRSCAIGVSSHPPDPAL